MMKRFLIFSLVISFVSCGEKVPKDILTIQQMQEIQWDLMRADELVDYYKVADTLYPAEQKRVAFYNRIFTIHHTNKEVFARSLDYYTGRPRELKEILDGVQARAEKLATADSAKSPIDTALIKKDTSRIPPAIDSLKRKKLLKINR